MPHKGDPFAKTEGPRVGREWPVEAVAERLFRWKPGSRAIRAGLTYGPLCETAWAFNGLSAAQKSPRLGAWGFVQRAKQILSADRYTGLQIRWTNNRQRRLGHDQFDPEGIPAPEIRRRVRLAQCVHAGLFRSGGCFGETRQLK